MKWGREIKLEKSWGGRRKSRCPDELRPYTHKHPHTQDELCMCVIRVLWLHLSFTQQLYLYFLVASRILWVSTLLGSFIQRRLSQQQLPAQVWSRIIDFCFGSVCVSALVSSQRQVDEALINYVRLQAAALPTAVTEACEKTHCLPSSCFFPSLVFHFALSPHPSLLLLAITDGMV